MIVDIIVVVVIVVVIGESISMSEQSMDLDNSSPADKEGRVIDLLKEDRRPFRRCGFGVVAAAAADTDAAAADVGHEDAGWRAANVEDVPLTL